MSRRVKNLVGTELQKRLGGVDSLVIVDYLGINANDLNKVRAGLRAKNVRLTVAPNAQAVKVLSACGWKDAAKVFVGTNALVYGGDSVVDVVKELVAQAKAVEKLRIKAAVVEGEILDARAAAALANSPNKKELKALIVGQALAPARALTGQIVSPGRKLAAVINALIAKKEKESPPAATAA